MTDFSGITRLKFGVRRALSFCRRFGLFPLFAGLLIGSALGFAQGAVYISDEVQANWVCKPNQ